MASISRVRVKHARAGLANYAQRYIAEGDGRPYVLLSFFFIILSLLLLPIIQFQIPPLYDYPNHLARLDIISRLSQDEFLARYYYLNWQVIPNIASDVIVPPFAELVGLYLAGKIFIITSIILIFTGVHAVYFAVYRHSSVMPLIGALIMYNNVMAHGLINYTFGIGVMLWGIAFWLGLREKSSLLRAAVSVVFVIATFFSHLAAFGLYALGLLAIELHKGFEKREHIGRATLVDVAVLGVPLLIVPLLMAVSPTGQHLAAVSWVSSGCTSTSLTCYFLVKLKGVQWVFEAYSRTSDLISLALILLGAFWMWRRHWLRAHPMAAWLAGAALVVYFALPTEAFGSSLTDVRLPVGMALLMIGFFDIKFPNRKAQNLFMCALCGILLFRIATILDVWRIYNMEWSEIRSSFQHIDRGSKILVARSGALAEVATVESVPCLAVVERSSLGSLVFAVHGQQILRLRSLYVDDIIGYSDAPVSVDDLISMKIESSNGKPYLENWREFYDYVYILHGVNHPPGNIPDNLQLLDSGRRYQLYRILR